MTPGIILILLLAALCGAGCLWARGWVYVPAYQPRRKERRGRRKRRR